MAATATAASPFIPTVNGRALVWYDDRPGLDAGWVLRYHRAPDTDDTGPGLRDLDEILPSYDPEDPAGARAAALDFLRREGITVL
jgi:hypothetical protein